ncbi:MAG: hypothetical protein OEY01_16705 [Desulfobulbaceae bacterium]|nr:hypothetical protein [Desulfobulbaceae bacterium]
MGHLVKIMVGILLLGLTFGQGHLFAQSIPEPRAACAYCGTSLPNGVHSSSCPYSAGAAKSAGAKSAKKAKAHSHSAELNAMVTGAIFQSLLTSMFTANTANSANQQQALAAQQKAAALAAHQAAEWQRAKDAAFQAEHRKMLSSFKHSDGGGVNFKGASDSELGFKALDGDLETLAADARKPFDTAGDMTLPVPEPAGEPTPFFGDTMPVEDLQLLVNPENDPRVVDLRQAKAYVVESLKEESARAAEAKPPASKDGGKPALQTPQCKELARKLDGFVSQRSKFQKTINLAHEQLVGWENANRNALVNAAKDGLEYFTGQLLDGLANRGKAADRLQRIYEANAGKMVQEGINVAEVEAKIRQLRMISSAGKISEITSNINDWQSFVKHGMSGLMMELNSSNQNIQELFENPQLQKYFEPDAPELKTLLDLSKLAAANKVFGKWVAKKIPLIAGVELAINQSYNALDWVLSFKRMTEANKINGQVMAAVRSLEQNIDVISSALTECP